MRSRLQAWTTALRARAEERRRSALALLLVAAAAGTAAGALAGAQAGRGAAGADGIPLDARSPREPAGEVARVLVEAARPPLGSLPAGERRTRRQQRAYVASLREEGASLRASLRARGVVLRDVVAYQRTWNGFAATVDADDLPRVEALGLRAEAVRRFYPAVGEPVPVRGAPDRGPRAPARRGRVALLASGVDARLGRLGAEVVRGRDLVDGAAAARPGRDPRDVRAREVGGTALASVLAAAGAGILPLRIASLRPAGAEGVQEHATSDALLAGLEVAVDPDSDGSTQDAVHVALAGVHAPYAGFPAAPEAKAIRAASRLGTLVVAPAGHAGPGLPGHPGTVGSPGAAPAALTVAAGAAAVPAATVRAADAELPAAALAGDPGEPGDLPLARAPRAPAEIAEAAGLAGAAAVVEAGSDPGAAAAAAAAAGARAVLLADARAAAVLPSMPAGRVPVPVLGLTGDAAGEVLALPDGTRVELSAAGAPASAPAGVSPFSSRGPSLAGTPAPDLAAPGGARVLLPGGTTARAGGAGIAAARVAAAAAGLAAADPQAGPAELTAALLASARAPAASETPADVGAGWLDAAAARELLSRAEPPPDPPAREAEPPPLVPLGALALQRDGEEVTGVRFTLGAFERPEEPVGETRLQAAGRLELDLVDASGATVRALTPPGGARDLLPAEYAYELPRRILRGLPDGSYAFRARAATPGRAEPVEAVSESFAP